MMKLRLEGALAGSPPWHEVRRAVQSWIQDCPAWAEDWTLVVRPKTAADDHALVEDGETEDPVRLWAVFVDDEGRRVTLAVPCSAEDGIDDAAHTAGFLIELLATVADPSAEDPFAGT
jgi:hypothetical protein